MAKEVAEAFYKKVYDDSIMNVLHAANKKTKGTDSEDIYIYWGLHFSTLKKMDSVEISRANIAKCLLKAFYRWKQRANILPTGTTRENALNLAEWDFHELRRNFWFETIKQF